MKKPWTTLYPPWPTSTNLSPLKSPVFSVVSLASLHILFGNLIQGEYNSATKKNLDYLNPPSVSPLFLPDFEHNPQVPKIKSFRTPCNHARAITGLLIKVSRNEVLLPWGPKWALWKAKTILRNYMLVSLVCCFF